LDCWAKDFDKYCQITRQTLTGFPDFMRIEDEEDND
jgi:hypothetical protein